MFEKYYKQHLAKRLLHGRSSSEDAGGRPAGWGGGCSTNPQSQPVRTTALLSLLCALVIGPRTCTNAVWRPCPLGASCFRAAEQLLLTKLKTECGYQFTSKLETMFGDIKLSRWAGGRGAQLCCACLEFDMSVCLCLQRSHTSAPLPLIRWPRREKMHDFKAHLDRKGTKLEVDMSVQVGCACAAHA